MSTTNSNSTGQAVFDPDRRDPLFPVERLGIVMEPQPSNADEAMGVLNPAAARGSDGDLYLFPRVVANGNYSRIARARVRFDATGRPVGADRLGYALEPTEPYERTAHGGGCEDPRVTYIAKIGRYVMTYTALDDEGPSIAVAVSDDLHSWRRLGLLHFAHARVNFNGYGNKDASFFPEPVLDPNGDPALAIIHRPTYRQHFPDGSTREVLPPHIRDPRESIWISYVNVDRVLRNERLLTHVHENHLLMAPRFAWEDVKLGGGPPPIPIAQGWLLVYHGITPNILPDGSPAPRGRYCAGAAVLDRERPWHVLYRSPAPIMSPVEDAECHGIVSNVVFPTGLDPRPDLGPRLIDIYYGMADYRIGAARLQVPEQLPLHLQDQHGYEPLAERAQADIAHPNPPRLLPPAGSEPHRPVPTGR